MGRPGFRQGKGPIASYYAVDYYDGPRSGVGYLEDGTPIKFRADTCNENMSSCSYSVFRIEEDQIASFLQLCEEHKNPASGSGAMLNSIPYDYFTAMTGEPLYVLYGRDPTEPDSFEPVTPEGYVIYRCSVEHELREGFFTWESFFEGISADDPGG